MKDNSPEAICERFVKKFNDLATDKFMHGQRRHGGCILKKNHQHEALSEVLDQWMYLNAWAEAQETEREAYEAEIRRLKETIELMKQEQYGNTICDV